MYLLYFLALILIGTALALLDLTRRINLLHPLPLTVYLAAALNPIGLGYWLYQQAWAAVPQLWRVAYLVVLALLSFYLWFRLNIWPHRDEHKLSPRLKAMLGGRKIIHSALWALFLQLIMLLLLPHTPLAGLPRGIWWANLGYAVAMLLILFTNGFVRIFLTSQRLSVLRRVVMVLTWWIPLVNLVVLLYACRLVYEEYDFAVNKQNLHQTRAHSDLCRTRYPLVMVHGILFRDLKYFNYWGRIPKELLRYGATVYYGNQEGCGTVETNAHDLKHKIAQVLAETGAQKVNIIAHSKGGLDARYCITRLGMHKQVASLTTINTPHHGACLADQAGHLPERIYRGIAKFFDRTFRKLGDQNPDFYSATRAFSSAASRQFNEQTPDMPGVYYQSYTSKMRNMAGDSILCIPYAISKPLGGDNDGLVTVTAAQWGNFRKLFEPVGRRGISHGDMIDLKREDIKGFDVREVYVQIVAELKEMGF